jgi:hypothetical protein
MLRIAYMGLFEKGACLKMAMLGKMMSTMNLLVFSLKLSAKPKLYYIA